MMAIALMISVPLQVLGADNSDLDQFRGAMIARGCSFDSTQAGQKLQSELGWDEAKFTEVILQLAIDGELICPSGCRLVSDRCPDMK